MIKYSKRFISIAAIRNLSFNRCFLSHWKCREYIVISLAEFLKDLTRRDAFIDFPSLLQ